ncbi:zinc-binding dehydrogenase [Latilactobacillus curvatus]|uniref:Zinc-binding dehydrogenase n=1 Tax=Latilactobacillus curvatus TaxID=28038 RepID=A0AAJ5RL64_LATCU|nr:zinc-binding dehydrogenase [Latilactobacillus curvatus]WDC92164.1 zinc-binding dehydrogenase [Latilactobacillus curvatus]
MKAAQIKKYNQTLAVTIQEIDRPQPLANEVLVKVAYAAVNPLDPMNIRGDTKLMQNYALPLTLGNEIAGEITAIGTDYWEVLDQIDYVIDTRGGADIEREMAIMKPGGRILSLIAGPNKQFAKQLQLPFWKQLLFSLAGRKWDRLAKKAGVEYRFIFVRSDGAQLKKITEIVEQQAIVPAIDPHQFDLAHVKEALELVAHGHPTGKVVIKVQAG